ncbi:MAG: NAD(+)/NADH kinase [Firmicutes bacterium]|nr:NAD(+)/NADH kinase [Bacillota bacterium]
MYIAFTYNANNPSAYQLMQAMAAYIKSKGAQVLEHDGECGVPLTSIHDCDFTGCDACVSLGGDGTLLATTRRVAIYDVPLFGVNMGQVGFLSAVEKDKAFDALDNLLAGNYRLQERIMLMAALRRNGQELTGCSAFNDIVVSSGTNSRAVTLDLSIDGEPINSYNADGIIMSTPTGCTGYSLSAGGPIILEDLEVTLITPVCPHSFFSRPIVASAASEVEIVNRSESQAASLTADGQFRFTLERDDVITVFQSPYRARMIRFNGDSYFQRIKRKLYV